MVSNPQAPNSVAESYRRGTVQSAAPQNVSNSFQIVKMANQKSEYARTRDIVSRQPSQPIIKEVVITEPLKTMEEEGNLGTMRNLVSNEDLRADLGQNVSPDINNDSR